MSPITLHLLAVPHTVTRGDYSHCAFTGKILRFAPMMATLAVDGEPAYRVVHYGVEGAESGADEQVTLIGADEWAALRRASLAFKRPGADPAALDDPAAFVGDLADAGTPLYVVFNDRARAALRERYRPGDLVLLPFGRGHEAAVSGEPWAVVESGIGYNDPFATARIYESFAWMHHTLGKEGSGGKAYSFVVPNYYDAAAWPLVARPRDAPLAERRGGPVVGFFGRICAVKGVEVVVEVARRCPDVTFVLCGQGDPTPWTTEPNVVYKAPLHGAARAGYLGALDALIAPSIFVEPFCGVAVEAQLCGTPVLAPAYGGPTETVVHGVTGVLCHVVADYVRGVRLAVEGAFDRAAIRARAVAAYDLPAVARRYDVALRTARGLWNGDDFYRGASFAGPEVV